MRLVLDRRDPCHMPSFEKAILAALSPDIDAQRRLALTTAAACSAGAAARRAARAEAGSTYDPHTAKASRKVRPSRDTLV